MNASPLDLKALAAARPFLLGGFVFSSDTNIPAIYAKAGYDFVVLDMEHCLNGLPGIQAHLRSCAAAGIAALVRVGASHLADVPRLLDGGAQGICFPHLGLAGSGVAEALASMRYAPQGTRPTCTGVAAAGFGLDPFPTYAQRANASLLSLGLVEDREIVEDIDHVLDTSPVDWVMAGPADLATSYGLPGELKHPTVLRAMEATLRAARHRHIATGAYIHGMDELPAGIDAGHRFFIHAIDYKILGKSLQASAAAFQEQVARHS
ncbi:HpcH/HpaI aldolase family protein [Hydrogenophaga sp.]|jgi:2-keto-3-deoxy-L-rhamnonate aldolase RhmA|uniref:HpcH/HpaI aldolase family protein n=1 Tax=Hydrogenophaga sp. TaxID=1904254 RepID=UPI003F70AFF8